MNNKNKPIISTIFGGVKIANSNKVIKVTSESQKIKDSLKYDTRK